MGESAHGRPEISERHAWILYSESDDVRRAMRVFLLRARLGEETPDGTDDDLKMRCCTQRAAGTLNREVAKACVEMQCEVRRWLSERQAPDAAFFCRQETHERIAACIELRSLWSEGVVPAGGVELRSAVDEYLAHVEGVCAATMILNPCFGPVSPKLHAEAEDVAREVDGEDVIAACAELAADRDSLLAYKGCETWMNPDSRTQVVAAALVCLRFGVTEFPLWCD